MRTKWKERGGRHELDAGRYLAFVEERSNEIPKWTLCVGGIAFDSGSAPTVIGAKRAAVRELQRRGITVK